MDGQDLPGPEFDDGDGDGSVTAMISLPAWAMPMPRWCMRPGPADADFAAFADVVVAQPVVAGRGAGGPGLRPGAVGLARGLPLHCAVRAVLVVVPAEDVELRLEKAGQGGGGRLCGEPAFLGLVEPFDLALGLGVERMPVLLGDAQGGQQVLEGVAAAAEAGGAGAPVAGQGRRGQPVSVASLQERVDDDFAGDRGMGAAAQQVAGVVVEPVDDLGAGPAAGAQWVKSDCQHSLG